MTFPFLQNFAFSSRYKWERRMKSTQAYREIWTVSSMPGSSTYQPRVFWTPFEPSHSISRSGWHPHSAHESCTLCPAPEHGRGRSRARGQKHCAPASRRQGKNKGYGCICVAKPNQKGGGSDLEQDWVFFKVKAFFPLRFSFQCCLDQFQDPFQQIIRTIN